MTWLSSWPIVTVLEAQLWNSELSESIVYTPNYYTKVTPQKKHTTGNKGEFGHMRWYRNMRDQSSPTLCLPPSLSLFPEPLPHQPGADQFGELLMAPLCPQTFGSHTILICHGRNSDPSSTRLLVSSPIIN